MSKRLNSIRYQVIEQLLLFKKKSIIYIVSFYVALILPTLIINSIFGILEDRQNYRFNYIENSIVFRWDSNEFKIPKFKESGLYTTICTYNEIINIDKNKVMSFRIVGIDENYPKIDKIPVYKGEQFNKDSYRNPENVCIVHETMYKNLSDKKYIYLGKNKYKIIGRIDDRHFENSVYVPIRSIKADISKSYNYKSIVINDRKINMEELSKAIMSEIKSGYNSMSNPVAAYGRDIEKNDLDETNKMISKRIIIAAISILFFVLNQGIITYEQLKENKKLYALKLSMGVTSSDLVICSFFESLILSTVSNLLLVLSIKRISLLLNDYLKISINLPIVFYIALTSILICILLNIVVVRWVSKLDIKRILVSEEE